MHSRKRTYSGILVEPLVAYVIAASDVLRLNLKAQFENDIEKLNEKVLAIF